MILRRPLLIEEFVVDTVRIADEHVWPAARTAQRAFCHAQVITHDVELAVSGLRKQDLVRIGDPYLAVVDVNDFCRCGSHGSRYEGGSRVRIGSPGRRTRFETRAAQPST